MPCKMTITSVGGEEHVGYCENALYLQEDECGKQVLCFLHRTKSTKWRNNKPLYTKPERVGNVLKETWK